MSESLRGNCYAASEALYYILGGKKAGWKPMRTKMVGTNKKLDTHWFLKHENGMIIDPSVKQFKCPPTACQYNSAIGSGFLTKRPSKHARRLIKELTWQQT